MLLHVTFMKGTLLSYYLIRGRVCFSKIWSLSFMTGMVSSLRWIRGPPHLSQMPSFLGFKVLRLNISPQFLQFLLFESLSMIICSGTNRLMIASILTVFSRAFTCSTVRGKPSRIKPFSQSCLAILFLTTFMTVSSGTS